MAHPDRPGRGGAISTPARAGKHLTFVPLTGATASPDGLRVAVSKEQVKDAPNLEQDGELDPGLEGDLYRFYELTYAPAQTATGMRLARR